MLNIKEQADAVTRAMIQYYNAERRGEVVAEGSIFLEQVVVLLQEIKRLDTSVTTFVEVVDKKRVLSS